MDRRHPAAATVLQPERRDIVSALVYLFERVMPDPFVLSIGLTLVVMVMVGRARIHAWALWLPNLVIRQITGSKTAVTVPEGDAS